MKDPKRKEYELIAAATDRHVRRWFSRRLALAVIALALLALAAGRAMPQTQEYQKLQVPAAEQVKLVSVEEVLRRAKEWKPVAVSATEPRTHWYYQRSDRNAVNDVEVWFKVVPPRSARVLPTGRKASIRYAYMMQFYVFHCADRRYSIEKLLFMNDKDEPVMSPPSMLASVFRDPVNPDSINETLFLQFCPK